MNAKDEKNSGSIYSNSGGYNKNDLSCDTNQFVQLMKNYEIPCNESNSKQTCIRGTFDTEEKHDIPSYYRRTPPSLVISNSDRIYGYDFSVSNPRIVFSDVSSNDPSDMKLTDVIPKDWYPSMTPLDQFKSHLCEKAMRLVSSVITKSLLEKFCSNVPPTPKFTVKQISSFQDLFDQRRLLEQTAQPLPDQCISEDYDNPWLFGVSVQRNWSSAMQTAFDIYPDLGIQANRFNPTHMNFDLSIFSHVMSKGDKNSGFVVNHGSFSDIEESGYIPICIPYYDDKSMLPILFDTILERKENQNCTFIKMHPSFLGNPSMDQIGLSAVGGITKLIAKAVGDKNEIHISTAMVTLPTLIADIPEVGLSELCKIIFFSILFLFCCTNITYMFLPTSCGV